MIIRMTIGDNDFQEELCSFAENLILRLSKVWQEAVMANDSAREKFFELLSPEAYPRLDNCQKRLVCEAVQRAWEMYVERKFAEHSINEKTKNYLAGRLKISVTYVLRERWENGEVVYYFTTAQKYITQ